MTQLGPDTYFVTAPYRLTVGEWPIDRWAPKGGTHARRAGTAFTACGLPALEWPIFWEYQFAGSREDACPRCAAITRET